MQTDIEKSEKVENGNQTDEGFEKAGSEIRHTETHRNFEPGKWSVLRVMGLLTMVATWAASQLTLYFVAGSLALITADLGEANLAIWLPTGWTVGYTALVPFSGYMSDLFGRKWVCLFGLTINFIGTVLVPTTSSLRIAIMGMVFVGAGAATSEMTALAGVSEMVPHRFRGAAVGFILLSFFPWTPYTLYAYLANENHSWRFGLWLCVIVLGVAILMNLFFFRPPPNYLPPGTTKKDILRKIDYIGALLGVASVVSLLLALNWGGVFYPWTSSHVLPSLLLGFFGLGLFIVWEVYGATWPMVPISLFKASPRVLTVTFILIFVGGMQFFSFLNFWVVLCETMFAPSSGVAIGVRAFFFSLGINLGSTIVCFLLSYFPSRMRLMMIVGTITMFIGCACVLALNPGNPNGSIGVGLVTGLGIGIILLPPASISLFVAPAEMIGTVVAVTLSLRTVGGSIASAIYNNVLQERLAAKLPVELAQRTLAAGLPQSSLEQFIETFVGNPSAITSVPGVTAQVLEAATAASNWSYTYALHWVFGVSLPFGLVAIIAAFCLGDLTPYMDKGLDIHRD